MSPRATVRTTVKPFVGEHFAVLSLAGGGVPTVQMLPQGSPRDPFFCEKRYHQHHPTHPNTDSAFIATPRPPPPLPSSPNCTAPNIFCAVLFSSQESTSVRSEQRPSARPCMCKVAGFHNSCSVLLVFLRPSFCLLSSRTSTPGKVSPSIFGVVVMGTVFALHVRDIV